MKIVAKEGFWSKSGSLNDPYDMYRVTVDMTKKEYIKFSNLSLCHGKWSELNLEDRINTIKSKIREAIEKKSSAYKQIKDDYDSTVNLLYQEKARYLEIFKDIIHSDINCNKDNRHPQGLLSNFWFTDRGIKAEFYSVWYKDVKEWSYEEVEAILKLNMRAFYENQ